MSVVPNYTDYLYGDSNQGLEPYMLYGDRSIPENTLDMKAFVTKDLEYLQGLYPGHMKSLHEYVVSACDHLDYKNSPMYDEYPDRLLVNQVCDSICSQIRKDGLISDEQFTGTGNTEQTAKHNPEKPDWESDGTEGNDLLEQQGYGWGPPPYRPPWGPPPGPKQTWGPPPGSTWCPKPGPHCGHPPGHRPQCNTGNNWLNDIVAVLFLNEMHRRRCRSGRCR
jgi:hypothetical protein